MVVNRMVIMQWEASERISNYLTARWKARSRQKEIGIGNALKAKSSDDRSGSQLRSHYCDWHTVTIYAPSGTNHNGIGMMRAVFRGWSCPWWHYCVLPNSSPHDCHSHVHSGILARPKKNPYQLGSLRFRLLMWRVEWILGFELASIAMFLCLTNRPKENQQVM